MEKTEFKKDDQNVKLKIVRHKWDDEKKEEKKQRVQLVILVCAIVVSFFMGILYNSATKVSNGTGNKKFTIFEAVYETMANDWYFGKDSEDINEALLQAAIKGMVKAQGDPHTEYMTAEEMKAFAQSLETSFTGIGIRYVQIDEGVLVREVLEFSPAEKSGLLAGDIITKVEGVETATMTDDELQKCIRGESGTDVVVTVLRDQKEFEMTITRGEIYTSVSSEIIDNIGHISISSFGTTTASELKTHLDKLASKNISKLIIDLRDNGGGYLRTLLDMTSFFMKEGTVVIQEVDKKGAIHTGLTTGKDYYGGIFKDIVILVNENSASCSEVFAAAMKEQLNATIIGVTTYGKGTVQVSASYPDGSALKYTTASWLTPNGDSIEGKGIEPDIEEKLHEALYQSYFKFEKEEKYTYDQVNENIKVAQLILDFLGYDVKRTDGYFDASTIDAIKAFQNKVGVTVNGNLDYDTAVSFNTEVAKEWGINRHKYDNQLKKAVEVISSY